MTTPSVRAFAKVVLLTKDETHIIEDFLIYYGHLFGFDNLVVIDNGSTEPAVLDVYERYKPKGVTIKVDRSPFPEAVRFMSDHMRALRDSCEWILPLETDEFLFLTDSASSGVPAERVTTAAIRDHLASFPSDVHVVRYGRFWGSCVDPSDASYVDGAHSRPPRDMTRFYDQNWDKIIVRASTFSHMVQWCHHAAIAPGGKRVVSDVLGLLHYHETGFRRQVESAVRVVDSFKYVDRTAPPMAQLEATTALCKAGVACGHKVEYYDKYLRRRIVLDAYRRKHGRMPPRDGEPDEKGQPMPRPETFAELLYHEDTKPHTFQVFQVSDFFARRALREYIASSNRRSTSSSPDDASTPNIDAMVEALLPSVRGKMHALEASLFGAEGGGGGAC